MTLHLHAGYLIRYGDTVHVTMKEDKEVKFSGEVSTTGFVTLPYYGPIQVSGLTEESACVKIKIDLERTLYQKATVSLVVVKRAVGYVYVYGAVGNDVNDDGPGKVEIPADKGEIRALQALAEVGGLSKWAAPNLAYILTVENGSFKKQKLALEEAYKNIGGNQDLILKPDDIIVVPSLSDGKVAPGSVQVMVAGKVEKPGVVFFEPGEPPSLIRAILKAGNFNKFADKSKVRLVRFQNGQSKIHNVDVEKLLRQGELIRDLKLVSGDLIVIDESWY